MLLVNSVFRNAGHGLFCSDSINIINFLFAAEHINVPMQGSPAYEFEVAPAQWHPPHPQPSAGPEQCTRVTVDTC